MTFMSQRILNITVTVYVVDCYIYFTQKYSWHSDATHQAFSNTRSEVSLTILVSPQPITFINLCPQSPVLLVSFDQRHRHVCEDPVLDNAAMFLHFKHCASTTETISIVRTFINKKKINTICHLNHRPHFAWQNTQDLITIQARKHPFIIPIQFQQLTSMSWRITERKRGIVLGYQQTGGLSEDQIIWAFFGFWMLCHSKRPIFILCWPEKKSLWAKWLEIWQNLRSSDSRPFTTTFDKNLI